MTYDTQSMGREHGGETVPRRSRRIIDRSRFIRRVVAWEARHHILRDKVVPAILIIAGWLGMLVWLSGPDLGRDNAVLYPTQSWPETHRELRAIGSTPEPAPPRHNALP